MTSKQKQIIFGVWLAFIIGMFMAVIPLHASPNYNFPLKEDNPVVTMDVDKVNGGGGTWRCPSVQACYIKILKAEARGATYYCNSIVIKRNGKVIWWRKYR